VVSAVADDVALVRRSGKDGSVGDYRELEAWMAEVSCRSLWFLHSESWLESFRNTRKVRSGLGEVALRAGESRILVMSWTGYRKLPLLCRRDTCGIARSKEYFN